MQCAYCESKEPARIISSMTAYPTKLPPDDPLNPNYVGPMCKPCEDDYVAYWTDMWDNYRASQGV